MAMCANTPTCRATAAQAGQRLDVAVGLLFPDYSVRARRRLWDSHTVLVNGKPRPCGFMVNAGDELCACPLDTHQLDNGAPATHFQPWLAGELPPHIVAEQQNLVFLYKPSGLHTAHLAGRGGPSLEALLSALAPDPASPLPPAASATLPPNLAPNFAPEPVSALDLSRSPAPHAAQAKVESDATPTGSATLGLRLVNRLDCGTSGLVVAARDASCAGLWQRMENAGLCEKHYLTLLCGRLPEPLAVRNTLDVDSRSVTKVLPTESTNPLRHSRFTPMGTLSAAALHVLHTALSAVPLEPLGWASHHSTPDSLSVASHAPNAVRPHSIYTVALCTIAKGARHQIRAHASYAGFPLWGDSLYATTAQSIQDLHGTPSTVAAQGTAFAPPKHHFLLHHGRLVLSGAVIQCLPVWFPLLPPDIQAAVQAAWPTHL